MLQVKNIRKKYVTGELEQIALNDVSLNLRDNEFVAILGQSGSGKTTLLNVIGGLDRYDSGDLIINGISTKNYSDRDWDSYRNHTIGFVFQSYNLIPHQTVLANVELALTISGISGAEKRQRAIDALTQVGLGNQLHKKPNQMSGGQMQRVAIARALVNNPDILLADEPTGALDSDTSIQVMDLLKEVAKDRLVVMVTHNPELAEQYATRIVRLSDGKIVDDNDPFLVDDSKLAPPKHANMGKASMSFLTSLALSFNNLRTKKGRTFLTSFAGSIGIIGIALILSLSNGVNTYIHNIEEETLSEYPVTVQTTDVDLASMIQVAASSSVDEEAGEEVNERKTISSFFSQAKKNDLKSLRSYLESEECPVYDYANAIEYSYLVTPQIYRLDKEEYYQVNPNKSFAELNRTYGAMASRMPYNIFSSLPESDSLYKDQYDVLEGHWPENPHQLVLVVSQDNCITDVALYAMGLKDPSELDQMIQDYRDGKEVEEVSEIGKYKYSDFIGKQFKMVNIADRYQFDLKRKLYVDKEDDEKYMMNLVKNGQTLEIVGVVKKNADSKAGMLSHGVLYPFELEKEIILDASKSDIVKAQIKDPEVDVFTGKRFDDTSKDSGFDSLFQFDTDAILSKFDKGNLSLDSSMFGGMDFSNMDMGSMLPDIINGVDVNKIFQEISSNIDSEEMMKMAQSLLEGYLKDTSNEVKKELEDIIKTKISLPGENETNQLVENLEKGFEEYMKNYPDPKPEDMTKHIMDYLRSSSAQAMIRDYFNTIDVSSINEYLSDLFTPEKMQKAFFEYVQSEEGQKIISEGIKKSVNTEEIKNALAEEFAPVMSKIMMKIGQQIASSLSSVMGKLSSSMTNMFSFDPDSFGDMFKMDMDEKEFQEIMMAMMSGNAVSYETNLQKLNYCDLNEPMQILIFPKDFDNKTKIIKLLDDYNDRMEKTDQKEKVVGFTDYVATLMSSVTDIIDTISYVLIAFVAISLVVSSIMIGIITYISVLERTKEIGILRAIGASKPNISQVFNAETFIIGLLAGVLGIVITLILLIPGNMLIHHLTGGNEVNAILPWAGAIILIIISVILTLIGGIIPSRAAAKKDPVTALRSE